jgi:hypothetical protein
VTVRLVAELAVIVAGLPLKVTTFCRGSKLTPVMVILAPAKPALGEMRLITGAVEKNVVLLPPPPPLEQALTVAMTKTRVQYFK